MSSPQRRSLDAHQEEELSYRIDRVIPCLATAQSILAVEALSLQDSGYAPHEAVDILAATNHRAYLAYAGQRAIGFCSCLITFWSDGPQLEIDMLGVIPEHRGQGVATAMVEQALADARKEAIRRVRAVVEVRNIASQSVFRRLGFVPGKQQQPASSDPTSDTVQMLVYDLLNIPPHADERLPKGWRTEQDPQSHGADVWMLYDERGRHRAQAETQQVQTLSYAGLWIEALWADTPMALQAMLDLLVREAARRGLDEVGYLAPSWAGSKGAMGAGHSISWTGWIRVGWYQIWRRHLEVVA